MIPDTSNAVNAHSCLQEALKHAQEQEKLTPGYFKPMMLLIQDAINQYKLDKKAYLLQISSTEE